MVFSVAAFIFGTLIGSFLNVVIWRLPQEQSLRGRSQCPHCGYQLRAINLVPVLSYLGQGRRCSNCGQPISPRYASIELVTGLLFAAAAWHLPLAITQGTAALELLRLWFILAVLIIVFVIDLEHYLIFDVVVWPAAIISLLLNIGLDLSTHHSLLTLSSHTVSGLLAAGAASGFFYVIWRVSHGRWMGFGDVKFNLFLGLALGLSGVAVSLFLAFTLGAVVGIGLIASRLKQLQSRVPFGTFLSVAAAVTLFFGPAIAAWYLHLIGWS